VNLALFYFLFLRTLLTVGVEPFVSSVKAKNSGGAMQHFSCPEREEPRGACSIEPSEQNTSRLLLQARAALVIS